MNTNFCIPAGLTGLQRIRLSQLNSKYDAKQPSTYDALGRPYLSFRANTIAECSLQQHNNSM